MTIQSAVTELVRKECEAYRLVDLGLLSSVEEGVSMLLPVFETADLSVLDDFARFRVWRKEVLLLFYRQLDYAGFYSGSRRFSLFPMFSAQFEEENNCDVT